MQTALKDHGPYRRTIPKDHTRGSYQRTIQERSTESLVDESGFVAPQIQKNDNKRIGEKRKELKRETFNVPAGEDRLTWTFQFPSNRTKRKESTESCVRESELIASQLQENNGKRLWKKRRQLPVQKEK